MQSFEALISLLVFVSIASSMIMSIQAPHELDQSLYGYQLANDAWRVLYLKGNFRDLDSEDELGRILMEDDAQEIKDMSGLCLFMMGTRYTNCRGGSVSHENIASVRKVVIEGGEPRQLTFSLTK